MINTTVWDIVENDNNNVIKVELGIEIEEDRNELIPLETLKLELDLDKVGVTKNMDYAFQLSKDLDNIVRKLWLDNNEIPTKEMVENEFHKISYIIIGEQY